MQTFQNRRSQITILVLSIIGIGISIYLTSVHYENVPLVCSTTGIIDCARVLSSKYSVVPGTNLPISLPGLAWCAAMGLLALGALSFWKQQTWIRPAEMVMTSLGMLSILYLIFVEIVELHTICAWCTGLHAIILVMFIISLLQLQSRENIDELEYEEGEDPAVTVQS